MSGFHICSVCLWITLASFPTAETIVTTGVCLHGLGRQVVPSAHMKALMQHYQAAGFSKEVTRLTAAPRRPSTNRMCDDRWLRFAHSADKELIRLVPQLLK